MAFIATSPTLTTTTTSFAPRHRNLCRRNEFVSRPSEVRRLPIPHVVSMSSSPTLEILSLDPITRLSGEISLPGSKSLSNRVLLLAALSVGDTTIHNLLDSDDVRYMKAALNELGVSYVAARGSAGSTSLLVRGQGGSFPTASADLFLGNAGTAMRPLSAALCTPRRTGRFVLDGTPRMRERPIKDLIEGLTQLGAKVSCSDTGCPPVIIETSEQGLYGGTAKISGKISSQYLSALLMAAPLASTEDVTLQIVDELVSVPYVKMTVNLMKRFGVDVDVSSDYSTFRIKRGQSYQSPGEIFVEGDASSASYFLAGGAITGGPVTVNGCGLDSIQGDVDFAKVLEQMGASVTWTPTSITVSRPKDRPLKGVDYDCGDIPDAAMSLATTALFAEGETAIRNVYNWRVKETERMKAIVTELTKLGAEVEEGRDYCIIRPPAKLNEGVEIDTYDDHRMAMSFSLVACGGTGVIIRDPKCTAKTFPTYFNELERLSS